MIKSIANAAAVEMRNSDAESRSPFSDSTHLRQLSTSAVMNLPRQLSQNRSKPNSRSISPLTSKHGSRHGSRSELSRFVDGDSANGGSPCRLNFEPCGSNDDCVSPYSERSTPPYMRWAIDLHHVLEDYEGYQLFTEFLNSEVGNDNELKFWYACEGFKKKCSEHLERQSNMQDDEKKIKDDELIQLPKRFYQEYIASNSKNSLACLSSDVRLDVHKRLMENSSKISVNIFDVVQHEVETNLRIRHAQFVASDLYINYVQSQMAQEDGGEAVAVAPSSLPSVGAAMDQLMTSSSSSNSSHSSAAEALVTSSGVLLPTVLEEPSGGDLEWAEGIQKLLATSSQDVSSVIKSNDESQPAVVILDATVATQTTMSADAQRPHSVADTASTSRVNAEKQPAGYVANEAASSSRPAAPAQPPSLPHYATASRRRPASSSVAAAALAMANQKLTHNSLVKTLQERMHSTVPSANQPGLPPNPYHTTRPYMPYLTTSTQDSELQSMSSEANTESSVSGAAFRLTERTALRNARQNADFQKIIPRTKRQQISEHQRMDMTDESFRGDVFQKLDRLKTDLDNQEKLRRTLDCTNVSYREAVQNYCLATAQKQNAAKTAAAANGSGVASGNAGGGGDDDEDGCLDILETHFSRLGWKDTPKRSPMRSPGMASCRRRSPPVFKPTINRIMTTSYPTSSAVGLTNFGAPPMTIPSTTTNNAQHTYSNNLNLLYASQQPSTSSNVAADQMVAPMAQPQASPRHRTQAATGMMAAATTPQQPLAPGGFLAFESQMAAASGKQPRYYVPPGKPKYASDDTSGVWSCVFSDPSSVGSSQTTQKSKNRSFAYNLPGEGLTRVPPNAAKTMLPQSVVQEKRGSKPSPSLHAPPGAVSSLSLSSSGSGGGGKKLVSSSSLLASAPKLSTWAAQQQTFSTGQQQQQNFLATAAPPSEYITVVYFLPNEPTPFRTKFYGAKMDLRDFKAMLPKKQASFKYYFKSEVADIGEVWEELSRESDVIPFHKFNEITARVDCVE